MKRILLFLGIISITLGSCTVREQFIVKARPRAPMGIKPPPPPVGASVWIPAEWVWNGYQNRYNWRPGHWSRPRVGFIWENGFWKNAKGGWYWIPGRWVRA